MLKDDQEVNAKEVVDHKVKKLVAKKVMRDIQTQVDEIDQQQAMESISAKFVFRILLTLLVIVILMLWILR